MRQAIVTRYHGPTDTKGTRVSATAEAGRIYVAWDYSLDTNTNHARAAETLARKFGWTGKFVAGGTRDYCAFVCDDGDGFTVDAEGGAA